MSAAHHQRSAEGDRLAGEQAALRRVATLVAQGAEPTVVFNVTTSELALLLGTPIVTLVRFETDETATILAAASERPFAVGMVLKLDGPSVIREIRRTGHPARIASYDDLDGEVATGLRNAGVRAGFGAPIMVNGKIWGAMVVAEAEEPAPPDAEMRLAAFTELEAMAIANAQALEDLTYLANEQASLRRVATAIAQGTSGNDLFMLVADEICTLLEVPYVSLVRCDDRSAVVVGAAGASTYPTVGTSLGSKEPICSRGCEEQGAPRSPIDVTASLTVLGRLAGLQAAVRAPILVEGQLWGAIFAVPGPGARHERAEVRLAQYTELVATAISNAATRAELLASRARIVVAGDEGRRRLERDLHDTIQQRLLALALDVQRVRGEAPAAAIGTRTGLERIEDELQSVLEEVQELSRGLHPALLSRGGLPLAVRALARRSPIPTDVDVETDPRPPEVVEIAAYYVIAEALTNAIKHSHASRIQIHSRAVDGRLQVVVSDDGLGGVVAGRGTGVSGMTDRVHATGGTLEIDSRGSVGTRVTAVLPFS